MLKNTKDQILETTQNLMSEKGYSQVSMSEIAEKVGIAKSSLYHFFSDKESLYGEIITLYINSAKDIYKYKSKEAPSIKLLSSKIRKALNYGEKKGGLLVSFENIKWSPNMAEKINNSFAELYKTLFETLEMTKIKEAEFATHFILDMSYAYIKKNQCGQKSWNINQFTNLLIKHLHV